jgi:hypothetical protein
VIRAELAALKAEMRGFGVKLGRVWLAVMDRPQPVVRAANRTGGFSGLACRPVGARGVAQQSTDGKLCGSSSNIGPDALQSNNESG